MYNWTFRKSWLFSIKIYKWNLQNYFLKKTLFFLNHSKSKNNLKIILAAKNINEFLLDTQKYNHNWVFILINYEITWVSDKLIHDLIKIFLLSIEIGYFGRDIILSFALDKPVKFSRVQHTVIYES